MRSYEQDFEGKTKKPMYLLTYDHGGYILWGDQFEDKIDSAVDWLEKYPGFKIGLDNETFAYDEYARSNPAIIAKINQVLDRFRGRFGIGSCTYGQPLSVFISEESNARQISYAVRANLRHFGQTPNIYAISEHALHNQIPQLAKQAGYQGAIMRTHYMMYGYNPTYDAPYGWWVGEDGTRIPTIPTYEGEGAQFAITTMDNWALTRWPDSTTVSLEQFGEKFAHLHPLLASRYDDIVLRQEGMLMHVEDIPEYQWVILEDLPALYGEPVQEFRPDNNAFRVRMPWGYCGNEIWNACSAAERDVTLAERADATAFLLGAPAHQEMLEDAWKNLMVAQHHDVQICGLLQDARKYLPASRNLSAQVTGEAMGYLAAQFATDSEHNLLVYNTHSFDVTQPVEIEVARRGAAGYAVTLDGQPVPAEVVPLDMNRQGFTRCRVRFEAVVPAGILQVYRIDTDQAVPQANGEFHYCGQSGTLTTPWYTLVLDDFGIRRLQERGDGTLIVDSARGHLFSGVINGVSQDAQGQWSVTLGANSARAVFTGQIGGIPVLFEMSFFGGQRRIECKARFLHRGESIGGVPGRGGQPGDYTADYQAYGFTHENKLRFVLDTRLGGDSVGVRDLPYTIAETDEPMYIQGNYWTARRGADFGVAFFNRGVRGAVVRGTEFSLPLAFAHTYIWGTRMLQGESEHEFALYPFAPDLAYTELHKQALAYSYPLLTRETGRHDGPIRGVKQILGHKGGDGVILTALYPEDGAVVMRFCEYAGETEALEPLCPAGRVGEQVTIMNQPMEARMDGKIGPREIRSYRVHKA